MSPDKLNPSATGIKKKNKRIGHCPGKISETEKLPKEKKGKGVYGACDPGIRVVGHASPASHTHTGNLAHTMCSYIELKFLWAIWESTGTLMCMQ